MNARQRVAQLVNEYRQRGDAVGWFEALYAEAAANPEAIPWAEMTPNPHLVEWLERENVDGTGKTAVVIGCGLGDDAETLSALGFAVTAFDVSPTAVEWCKRRFPETKVNYVAADLFHLPEDWRFDFVSEIYTVQALPVELREQAIAALAGLVAPGGRLLAVGRLVNSPEERGVNTPWPLTRAECDLYVQQGLTEVHFENFNDGENPPVHRFRVEYRR